MTTSRLLQMLILVFVVASFVGVTSIAVHLRALDAKLMKVHAAVVELHSERAPALFRCNE